MVCTFSGCPGGAPGDRTPNWVTCPWPTEYSRIVEYQWNDVLAPYWDGERFLFMLVVRDNPEHVDWRLQIDMSRQEFAGTSTVEKDHGLFPLAITSYGDEADVRYAALWVRYRLLE